MTDKQTNKQLEEIKEIIHEHGSKTIEVQFITEDVIEGVKMYGDINEATTQQILEWHQQQMEELLSKLEDMGSAFPMISEEFSKGHLETVRILKSLIKGEEVGE